MQSRRIFELIPVALLAASLATAAIRIATVPLWFDEFMTWAILRAGSASAIIQELRLGHDGNPPLSYLLTHWLAWWIPSVELRLRFVSALATLSALPAVYLLGRRWGGWIPGVTALVLFRTSFLFAFAWEARPYAIWIAASVWAAWFWLAMKESGRPARPAAGFIVALLIAMQSHYLGVLTVFPFAVAEALGAWKRTFDRLAAACILAVAALWLAFLPTLLTIRQEYSGSFWAPSGASPLIVLYGLLQVTDESYFVTGLVLFATLLALFVLRLNRMEKVLAQREPWETRWLLALAATAPLLALASAIAKVGIAPRYLGFTGVGVTLLFAATVMELPRWVRIPVVCGLLLLTMYIDTEQIRAEPISSQIADLRLSESEGPIVVDAPLLYPQLVCYLPESLRSRLVLLTDYDKARRWTGTDTPFRNLRAIEELARDRLHLSVYSALPERFLLLVVPDGKSAWVASQLYADGVPLLEHKIGRSSALYQVVRPSVGSAPQRTNR